MNKWLAVLLVMGLYALPCYQEYWSDPQARWPNLRIAETLPPGNNHHETPYFAQQFVNQAQPGVMCHVPAIAVAGKDRLICTWYAGSREGAQDVAVYAAFFQEGAKTWTEPQVVVDPRRSSQELRRWVRKVGNAVVVNDRQGGLWLFYASMLGGWSTTSLNYKVSHDEGRTWSASRKLILSPFFNLTNNVKNKGVALTHGAYLLPVYHEFLHKFSQVLFFRPVMACPAHQIRRMTGSGRAIQPALIPQDDMKMAAFFRNAAGEGKNFILRAGSTDVGQNWSELTNTSLPHPDAGFDMIRLTDGAILGAINHAFQDRSDLTLVLSPDEGKTWRKLHVLEDAPGKEYTYPSLTRSQDKYHLAYTYERKRIKHVVFNEAWIKELKKHDH